MPKFNSHQIKKEKFIYLWHLYVFICMLKIKVNQSTQKQLSRTKKQTETHSPVTVCNIQSVKVTLYLPFVSPAECLTSQTSLRGRQHAETKQICQKTGKATGGNPFSRGNKADSEAVKIVAPTLRIFFPLSSRVSRYIVMVSCTVLILGPLCIHGIIQACMGEELSRGAVLSWFKVRVLEGLGLEEPPLSTLQGPDADRVPPDTRHLHQRAHRTSRTSWVNPQTRPNQESSQIILFPGSGEKFFCTYLFEWSESKTPHGSLNRSTGQMSSYSYK